MSSFKKITLTTPAAIIIGALIISLGLMGYGLITSGSGSSVSTTDPLPKILKSIGVNKNDFAKCVNSGEEGQAVANSETDGIKAGVNGTPTTFILREENGVFYTVANISGAQAKELFKQAIEQALATTNVAKLPKFVGLPIGQNDLQEVSAPTKVYVVEYSDAECPFCIKLHPDMKALRTEYAGRISYVYRNFPLPASLHPHAEKEAEMISCIGKLGGAKALYPYIDATFDYKFRNNTGYMPWNFK